MVCIIVRNIIHHLDMYICYSQGKQEQMYSNTRHIMERLTLNFNAYPIVKYFQFWINNLSLINNSSNHMLLCVIC